MAQPIISQETKDENFQAIAPTRGEPVMVRTHANKSRLGSFGILFLFLFLAAAAATIWFYKINQDLRKQLSVHQTSQVSAAASGHPLTALEKLNRHILLPQAQNAEITSIENVQNLKNNDTFYQYASNGDLLIQFPNLEIIYDNSADVIVNARTKNTGQVAGAEVRAMQGVINLEIRNGSGVSGAAGKTAQTFDGVKQYIVKAVGNAAKNDYAKTIIINLSGKDVSGLEKQFNTKAVTVLPAGEKSSNADVVIIVGKN